MTCLSRRGQCCWPVELRLWSSSWEGRKPVGLEEGRFAAVPLFTVSSVDCGVLEGSNTPKASCHSLLNSSLAPGPGLRRSLRKAMSPRSTSSSSICSIVPVRREGPSEKKIAGSHKKRKVQIYKEWKQRARKVKTVESPNMLKLLPQPSKSEEKAEKESKWEVKTFPVAETGSGQPVYQAVLRG